MRALMLFLLLACAYNLARSETFTAKIIAVLDGDTVLIRRAAGVTKIRLAEIDAPEVAHAGMGGKPPHSQKAQAFGAASQHSLSDMVLGKQVKITSQAVDQYGRMVAHLSMDGLDVNAEQIRRGMAWEYSSFHSNKTLLALQEEARKNSLGLWEQSAPTPPWIWRKQHPDTAPANAKTAAPSPPTCGNKTHCSEMLSCDEARHYFTACGLRSLDGDDDGTPCEKLCGRIGK